MKTVDYPKILKQPAFYAGCALVAGTGLILYYRSARAKLAEAKAAKEIEAESAAPTPIRALDPVEEMSWESFPASDAPAW